MPWSSSVILYVLLDGRYLTSFEFSTHSAISAAADMKNITCLNWNLRVFIVVCNRSSQECQVTRVNLSIVVRLVKSLLIFVHVLRGGFNRLLSTKSDKR